MNKIFEHCSVFASKFHRRSSCTWTCSPPPPPRGRTRRRRRRRGTRKSQGPRSSAHTPTTGSREWTGFLLSLLNYIFVFCSWSTWHHVKMLVVFFLFAFYMLVAVVVAVLCCCCCCCCCCMEQSMLFLFLLGGEINNQCTVIVSPTTTLIFDFFGIEKSLLNNICRE